MNLVNDEGLPGGGHCSLVPFQNCPMFPCYRTFSLFVPLSINLPTMFSSCNLVSFVPLFRKNRLMFPSIFCHCSVVPQTPERPSTTEMLAATIVFVFGVLLIKVTVFTRNQQAELRRSSSREEQTENARKPCVDQKKTVLSYLLLKSYHHPCFIVNCLAYYIFVFVNDTCGHAKEEDYRCAATKAIITPAK